MIHDLPFEDQEESAPEYGVETVRRSQDPNLRELCTIQEGICAVNVVAASAASRADCYDSLTIFVAR